MDAKLDIRYEDWHAVHDHMGKTLRVAGNRPGPHSRVDR
jgi:hypothetical protein